MPVDPRLPKLLVWHYSRILPTWKVLDTCLYIYGDRIINTLGPANIDSLQALDLDHTVSLSDMCMCTVNAVWSETHMHDADLRWVHLLGRHQSHILPTWEVLNTCLYPIHLWRNNQSLYTWQVFNNSQAVRYHTAWHNQQAGVLTWSLMSAFMSASECQLILSRDLKQWIYGPRLANQNISYVHTICRMDKHFATSPKLSHDSVTTPQMLKCFTSPLPNVGVRWLYGPRLANHRQ